MADSDDRNSGNRYDIIAIDLLFGEMSRATIAKEARTARSRARPSDKRDQSSQGRLEYSEP